MLYDDVAGTFRTNPRTADHRDQENSESDFIRFNVYYSLRASMELQSSPRFQAIRSDSTVGLGLREVRHWMN